MADERDKVSVPEDLRPKILEYFGDASTSDAGAMVAAMWYAAERYQAEHDIDPQEDVE